MNQDRVKRDARRASKAWRERIGAALRSARQSRRLTQAQLAGQAGVDLMTVSKIERGVTVPDLATLWTLADLLGFSLDQVVGRSRPAGDAATAATEDDRVLDRLRSVEEKLAGLQPGDLQTVTETARSALALAQRLEAERSPRRKRRVAK